MESTKTRQTWAFRPLPVRPAPGSASGTSCVLHWSIISRVHTVVETPGFLADARGLGLTGAERWSMVVWIAANPMAGEVMEGTGGARKVRFAGKGKEENRGTPDIARLFSNPII